MKKYVTGRFFFQTDVGKVRLSNEDQALALTNPSGNILLIVCDGMGGQNKGDFASNLAVSGIAESFKARKGFLNKYFASTWMNKTVRKVNKEIFAQASSNPEYKGMGTTLTMVLIYSNWVIICQIGDSRAYMLDKNRKFNQVSEDQSYVAYLYRTGQIKEEEMATHPKRHVLMNALGVFPSANADIKIFPYHDESILLCSDGLYNNVSNTDIATIIKGEDSTEQKVNELISLANANGGSDNIAVVLWEAQE